MLKKVYKKCYITCFRILRTSWWFSDMTTSPSSAGGMSVGSLVGELGSDLPWDQQTRT